MKSNKMQYLSIAVKSLLRIWKRKPFFFCDNYKWEDQQGAAVTSIPNIVLPLYSFPT